VIQIEAVHIKELRGIRDLTLTLNRGSFVVSGPNGSGKSGIVDAIQFALTGEISRLQGAGTGELKLSVHGPHVGAQSYPDASFVRLDVYIPHLGKSASVTRRIKTPKHLKISPNDDDVKAVFDEIAQHPEITLSRREIIRFILTEASKRSHDVQALLKLDDIDQTRGTLKTTENKLNTAYSTAKAQAESAEESLKRHLDLPKLSVEGLLSAINTRRRLLDLPEIKEIGRDTAVSEGLSKDGATESASQTKESALRDLKAISDVLAKGVETSTESAVTSALQNLAKVDANPDLLSSLKRRSLLQTGLDLVDGPHCPLCDTEWNIEALRAHLREKLEHSKEAQAVRDELLESGRVISNEIIRLRGLIEPLARIAEVETKFVKRLGEWSGNLLTFAGSLSSLEGMVALKERFESGWASTPETFSKELQSTWKKVKARPDKSATGEARDFLVVAQDRLNSWRLARRDAEKKNAAASRGKIVYKTYCDVAETALVDLYAEVEGDFGKYYQLLNNDDEGEFKAKFEPTDGKLGLLVDFHKKGMFPPGAYHSEGHQDGMGVCLYLALMKRVLGTNFTLSVLDDVVMSIDSQHRKQFCKLLKTYFPDTQFVITTHDQVWARQIRTEGVVGAKSAVTFHTWTVETGPILDEVAEVWDQIEADLATNEVPTAAGRLRRHLEYVAADLADELGAKVKFRADGGYDMGELLSAVIGRQAEILKSAAKAAKSWDDKEQVARVEALQKDRAEILASSNGEQWVINKAIHYNEWANLTKNDFKPVVKAFRELLQQFRCEKPKCNSWLSLIPKFDPVELRCSCGSLRLNLKEK
jgi:energy-coupling factor transporter ATP-binding protein EcfA2